MVDAFVNRNKETIYLIMDLIEGSSVKEFVTKYNEEKGSMPYGGLPESLCKSITRQLLKTMEYLHSEPVSVCHRDTNPNNVMVTHLDILGSGGVGSGNFVSSSDEVKVTLIDFNVSRRFREKPSSIVIVEDLEVQP
jgi:serine/threonine protein kinase